MCIYICEKQRKAPTDDSLASVEVRFVLIENSVYWNSCSPVIAENNLRIKFADLEYACAIGEAVHCLFDRKIDIPKAISDSPLGFSFTRLLKQLRQ